METKPAIYTTEFWTSILSSFYMFLNTVGVLNEIPSKWATVGWAIIAALYALSRGVAKNKGSVDPALSSNYTLVPRRKKLNR